MSLPASLCLLWAVALVAGSASAEPNALGQFLSSTQTLTAEFRQELRDAAGIVVEVSEGTVLIKRPNRFQWLYREPYEQLVLADGERLWVYDKDLGQASVAPIGDALAATPAMLLSGDGAVDDQFEMQAAFQQDGLDWVLLKPKQTSSDFRSVAVAFQASALKLMELKDNLGQVTWIEFSNLEVNPDLADESFQFEPPEGVDVIGEAG